MDAANKALCWAKGTLNNLIIDTKIKCYIPRIVPKKLKPAEDLDDRMIGPLRITPNLDIDPDTLMYIASQHDGECYWDTFQNILMFADGYRDVNVKFIMDDYSKHPRELLPIFYETDAFKDRISKFYGTTDKTLINFLAGTFLRYINIKKLEKEEMTSITGPKIERARSVNTKKGITLKKIGDQICPTYWNDWTSQDPIKLYNMIKNMKPFKDTIILHNKEYKGVEYREGENKFKLIGVFIGLNPTDKTHGHAVGIIRFKDKFYLLDDNIGYAVEINNIEEFDGYNLIMKFTLTKTIFSFADKEIFISKDKLSPAKVMIFSQLLKTRQIFQYMRT